MPLDPEIFGSTKPGRSDSDIFKDVSAPTPREEARASVEPPARRPMLGGMLGLSPSNLETATAIEKAKSQGWGTGMPMFNDWLANFVAATGRDLGLSPGAAAVPGAVTYGLANAIPMLATAVRGGPGSVAAENPSLTEFPARKLMQSAVKPSSTLPPQDVRAALGDMLKENIYPTSSGMNKASAITRSLDQKVNDLVANSPAQINIANVTSRLDALMSRVGKQVNPKADTAAVENAWTEFLTSPNIAGRPQIPVQLAHELKQGTYASLGGKSYGEVGSAATEAQKQLARGLREEVSAAVPEVSPLLARQASLMNIKDVAGTRALIEANKNPMGLAALRMDNPLSAATFMADRWAALKAFLAMQMYAAGKPQVFGPALMATPQAGALYQQYKDQQ